jgi:hypothetical protein
MNMTELMFGFVPLAGMAPIACVAWWRWSRSPREGANWRTAVLTAGLVAASLVAVIDYGWLMYSYSVSYASIDWRVHDQLDQVAFYLMVASGLSSMIGTGSPRRLVAILTVLEFALFALSGVGF